jgi:hypothetical protein
LGFAKVRVKDAESKCEISVGTRFNKRNLMLIPVDRDGLGNWDVTLWQGREALLERLMSGKECGTPCGSQGDASNKEDTGE